MRRKWWGVHFKGVGSRGAFQLCYTFEVGIWRYTYIACKYHTAHMVNTRKKLTLLNYRVQALLISRPSRRPYFLAFPILRKRTVVSDWLNWMGYSLIGCDYFFIIITLSHSTAIYKQYFPLMFKTSQSHNPTCKVERPNPSFAVRRQIR